MALDTEKIIEDLKGASILELNDLVKAIDCLLYTSPSPRDS